MDISIHTCLLEFKVSMWYFFFTDNVIKNVGFIVMFWYIWILIMCFLIDLSKFHIQSVQRIPEFCTNSRTYVKFKDT